MSRRCFFQRVVLVLVLGLGLGLGLGAGLCAGAEGGGVLDLFDYFQGEEAWKIRPDLFVMRNRAQGFRFVNPERTMAASTDRDRLRCLGEAVYEARVYWGEAGIRRVEISIYNKGDAREALGQEAFVQLAKRVHGALCGKRGDGLWLPEDRSTAPKIVRGVRWDRESPMVLLEWGYVERRKIPHQRMHSPFQAEFVQVKLVPRSGKVATDTVALTGKGVFAKARDARELRARIQRESNGDVRISVPMVDQGAKGYCAAAVGERILRYYGIEVDQHQVAQLAETSAVGGTSLSGIVEAISSIGRKYKLDEKSVIAVDVEKTFQKSQTYEDLERYNQVAKRKQAVQIDWRKAPYSTSVSSTARLIHLDRIWGAMDPEILLESRLRYAQGFDRFKREIRAYIDMGVPLFWVCLVGLYPEVPDVGAEGVFGHVRLIVGYNTKTGDVLYSDSWGPGHECKRMSAEQAWATTKGLLALRPR